MFQTTAEAKGSGSDLVKHASATHAHSQHSITDLPRRYFYCGSSVLHVVMSVCISSSAIWSPE